ncbi:MAG: YegP family protein [Candidatus Limnocylindrales bacterium]
MTPNLTPTGLTAESVEHGVHTLGGTPMAGKFVLKKNAKGQYHFSLKAGNGEIIATSETYTSKSAAMNGIESVKANASGATIDDQTGGK